MTQNTARILFQQAAFLERPNQQSRLLTGVLFWIVLSTSEYALNYVLSSWHPHAIFQTELHRQIVARYVGVDAVCCIIMAVTGLSAIRSPNSQFGKLRQLDYSQRLYAYYPANYRVALYFCYYQIKDLIDSIWWKDKPELIFHHILSLTSAVGCLSSETGLFYAPFFFGLSEVSTIALCCLVNFDLELGVPGLADEFPLTKTIVGVVFVVLFLICRCMAWPYFSYYFCRDVVKALSRDDDPQLKQRKFWIYFFLVALSGLSLLQVLWLGQIIVTVQKEFAII